MYLRTVLTLLASCLYYPSALAVGYGEQAAYSVDGKETPVRRERNLDHWDGDTLAYYLDEYRGNDVAIMFYANWDRNSHALAPYWDRIATVLDAGNSKSRLVMSLFDCELNAAHAELCSALNIEAYPTLMFVGSGPYHDTDPVTKTVFGKRSAGIMGEAPVSNTVKFQGNWQYGDAILDWIRTMQALSNWHLWTTTGFGRRLRNFLLPHKTPNKPLPVGVPRNGAAGGARPALDYAETKALEHHVEALTNATNQLEKMVLRSDGMMQNMLLPQSDQDMFAVMKEEEVWKSYEKDTTTEKQLILYSCLTQMALDYCQRVSKKVAFDMVTELEAAGASLDEMMAMPTLEQDILNLVTKKEPYCGLMDQCVLNNFKDKECRPNTCPFQNDVACRYLTSCLDPDVQSEYAEALALMGTEQVAAEATRNSGWGM